MQKVHIYVQFYNMHKGILLQLLLSKNEKLSLQNLNKKYTESKIPILKVKKYILESTIQFCSLKYLLQI